MCSLRIVCNRTRIIRMMRYGCSGFTLSRPMHSPNGRPAADKKSMVACSSLEHSTAVQPCTLQYSCTAMHLVKPGDHHIRSDLQLTQKRALDPYGMPCGLSCLRYSKLLGFPFPC